MDHSRFGRAAWHKPLFDWWAESHSAAHSWQQGTHNHAKLHAIAAVRGRAHSPAPEPKRRPVPGARICP